MEKSVTLKDVAREAGVHTSTASRALNPETRSVVNPETVDRILAVARDLGYRPHPLARGLRTNRTMTVGMVIPDVENPLFGSIIAGAESVLGKDGYSLLIADAGRDPEHLRSVVAALIERRVDGLIMATASRSDGLISEIVENNVKVVLVNRSAENVAASAIVGDDHAGIGLAVDHLAKLGHTRIGHLAGPRTLSTGMDRYQAFVNWMERLDLEVRSDAVEEATWYQVKPGYHAARTLLTRRPDLTAIVASNDLIGLGSYRAVREMGKEVGRDVSITGYNDIPLLDLMHPGLTSVRVPYREMGAESARAILGLIGSEAGARRPAAIRLTPSLSVRDSTAPPPA